MNSLEHRIAEKVRLLRLLKRMPDVSIGLRYPSGQQDSAVARRYENRIGLDKRRYRNVEIRPMRPYQHI